MCAIAASVLGVPPRGWTAPSGPELLSTPEALASAARLVAAASVAPVPDAVIVSAFGDPGAAALAEQVPCPVIGIGAASARAASRAGRPFAVATTTPALEAEIDALMSRHAAGVSYLGCHFAKGDPEALMQSETALDEALLAAVTRAIDAGAEAVIIGGGPLGMAAERLRRRTSARLLNPVVCAAREVAAVMRQGA